MGLFVFMTSSLCRIIKGTFTKHSIYLRCTCKTQGHWGILIVLTHIMDHISDDTELIYPDIHFEHSSLFISPSNIYSPSIWSSDGSVNFLSESEQKAKARRHGGQSHRKLRLQTISHPAPAEGETLPPLQQHIQTPLQCTRQRWGATTWAIR